MIFENQTIESLIELYDNSKELYYNTGESTLSDSKFDELEEYLLSNGYIEKYIGTTNIHGTKIPHRSPMLSLDKVQVFTMDFQKIHADSIFSALARYSHSVNIESMLEVSYKIDGLAISITYYMGKLQTMATRGNGSIGTDVTDKYKHLVPNTISNGFSGEVRGELFINKSTFVEKYADVNKNPRNLAVGITAVDNLNDPRIKDVNIRLFESKGSVKNIGGIPELAHLVIEKKLCFNDFESIKKVYDEMNENRSSIDYPTDGIVIRLASIVEHRDNGLAPLYAVSVKFPPMLAKAVIKDVEWNLRKTGYYIPRAIFHPVELDGTIVVHASLHNYNYVNSKGCYKGAEVIIGKNGDIIPQIQEVVTKAPVSGLPENYKISENGLHMSPSGDMTKELELMKFTEGLLTLGLHGFGKVTLAKVFELLDGKAENIFDNSLFVKERLLPVFGSGKTGPSFIKQRNLILNKGFTISKLITMLQFDNCGLRHADNIAKHFEGKNFNDYGLNRSVVNDLIGEGENNTRILQAIELYKANFGEFIIQEERKIMEGAVTFEMTGSPKMAGYKTKEDFVSFVSTWIHTKLKKDTTYLITDDKVSSTSKMKFAEKNSIVVLTYDEATKLFIDSLN